MRVVFLLVAVALAGCLEPSAITESAPTWAPGYIWAYEVVGYSEWIVGDNDSESSHFGPLKVLELVVQVDPKTGTYLVIQEVWKGDESQYRELRAVHPESLTYFDASLEFNQVAYGEPEYRRFIFPLDEPKSWQDAGEGWTRGTTVEGLVEESSTPAGALTTRRAYSLTEWESGSAERNEWYAPAARNIAVSSETEQELAGGDNIWTITDVQLLAYDLTPRTYSMDDVRNLMAGEGRLPDPLYEPFADFESAYITPSFRGFNLGENSVTYRIANSANADLSDASWMVTVDGREETQFDGGPIATFAFNELGRYTVSVDVQTPDGPWSDSAEVYVELNIDGTLDCPAATGPGLPTCTEIPVNLPPGYGRMDASLIVDGIHEDATWQLLDPAGNVVAADESGSPLYITYDGPGQNTPFTLQFLSTSVEGGGTYQVRTQLNP